FFSWLNPRLKLPNRQHLSGSTLTHAVNEIEQSHRIKLNQTYEQAGVMLVFDSWKNVLKQELLGTMLVLPSSEPIVWKVLEISGERNHAVDILLKIKELIDDLHNENIKLAAIISDSAASYASA
ncbi:10116_t:CDS:1, partial [Scutellospora calospora]